MQKSTEQIIKSIIAIQDTNELRVVANALHQHRTYMNAQATRNLHQKKEEFHSLYVLANMCQKVVVKSSK